MKKWLEGVWREKERDRALTSIHLPFMSAMVLVAGAAIFAEVFLVEAPRWDVVCLKVGCCC